MIDTIDAAKLDVKHNGYGLGYQRGYTDGRMFGREQAFDKVLEIIDELNDTKALASKTQLGKFLHDTLASEIKAAIMELKGGEQG